MANASRFRRRSPGSSRFRRFRDLLTALGLIAALALAASWLGDNGGGPVSGTARIVDGDSLEIGGKQVRLKGVDAPEFTQTCEREGIFYRCGVEARDALIQLIAGHEVNCELDGRDRYRRYLGWCSASGVDLNRAMVLSGHAVSYDDYRSEEAQARAARAGVWAGEFERPEAWRAEHDGRAPPFRLDWVIERFADGLLALKQRAVSWIE